MAAARIIIRDGILVFVPEKDFTRYDEEDPVKAAREERDRKCLGLDPQGVVIQEPGS